MENALTTNVDWGLLVLRVGLGIIFLPHGRLKLDPQGGMGGVAGFSGFLRQLGVPMPVLLGWFVVLLETVGAVMLIFGLLTRILALALAIDMLVAIVLVKQRMAKKRFMERDGTGWEFEFALLVAALALVFTGAGSISLDRAFGL
jgi:putative oxidoreductase